MPSKRAADSAPAGQAKRTAGRTAASVYRHYVSDNPFGIKPLGNMLFDSQPPARPHGLGAFAPLDDHLLLELLADSDAFGGPDGDRALCRLARASRAWYCLAYNDAVWRQRTIARFGGDFVFAGSWRNTFKRCVIVSRQRSAGRSISDDDGQDPPGLVRDAIIRVPGMFSDVIYTSWRCSSVPLEHLCGTAVDNIDRRSGLSMADFVREYTEPNRPVILTDVVTSWPAFGKWSMDYFVRNYGRKLFRAEAVDMAFEDYARYAAQAHEESPLYLFDKHFAEDSSLAADYTVPEFFAEDLFQVLGNRRPDYRWLIVGPARSGSTFHVDPNSTSAWNAVITGAKKWVMFPPEHIPPGVFPSADGSEVTSPVSLAEWFMNYYSELDQSPATRKHIECVCRAGEILYVPNGWWHCVMNLSESIAVTQNFVTSENLVNVLDFAEFRPEQVSGFCHGDLYTEFVDALRSQRPEVLEATQKRRAAKLRAANLDAAKARCTVSSSESFWSKLSAAPSADGDTVEADEAASGGSFLFSFE